MHINPPIPIDKQMSKLGRNNWYVSRLISLSSDFEVFDAPIDCINVYKTYDSLTMRDMVHHLKSIMEADLSFPIILDEDGEIMDGRHRIMKAILNGDKTIKAVRFDINPTPDKVD